jgi:integrase
MWGGRVRRRIFIVTRHPDKALNAVRVNALKEEGRYADGNGLYLVVDPSGAKRWLLRTMVHGRRRDIGLGSTRLVTLADAREQARALRRIARDGGDPLEAKRQAAKVIPTFAEAAQQVHAEHSAAWRNAKHGDQWINTLTVFAFPHIGQRRLDQIGTSDILNVLSPVWLTRPETARRVRQRLKTVFDWAKVKGFRSDGNPVEAIEKALPRQGDRRGHFAAMPYAEVPAFIRDLRQSETGEGAKLALEFLILTATRTSEVLQARWEEIDHEKKVWTIPAARMKGGREHRVPLSPRALDILTAAKALNSDDHLVFAGRSAAKPMSNMVFLMALRRMKVAVTAHGFRSAFRDWAAERTNMPREVCEAALAHVVKDKTEAAYRRGDLFEKRRDLMDTWAAYLATTSATVIPLRASS